MSKQAILFLADESCDFAVVRALRAAGHDVKAVSEVCPGVPDEEVMQIGIEEGRILGAVSFWTRACYSGIMRRLSFRRNASCLTSATCGAS